MTYVYLIYITIGVIIYAIGQKNAVENHVNKIVSEKEPSIGDIPYRQKVIGKFILISFIFTVAVIGWLPIFLIAVKRRYF